MDFWNDEITKRSWERLMELKNKFNFVLIGGWAVFMYTGNNRSKDIDIVVDYNTLWSLKASYDLYKNERLKKYEIKFEEGVDIDIYVPNYSELVVPIKDILDLTITNKEGFILPEPEVLLILKIPAFIARQNKIKGIKDAIDIVGLVFFADCDLEFFKELTTKYELYDYPRILLSIIENFDRSLIKYLNLNENEFAKLKKKYIEEIRKIL